MPQSGNYWKIVIELDLDIPGEDYLPQSFIRGNIVNGNIYACHRAKMFNYVELRKCTHKNIEITSLTDILMNISINK